MRDCKELINACTQLDFEDSWDTWDPPLYDIESIMDCRKRNELTEYKVRFVSAKGNCFENEWKASADLVNAKRLLKSWTGGVKPCNQIKAIHKEEGDLVLVQWHGWPHKQDWTWEEKEMVTKKAGIFHAAFLNKNH